MPQIGEIRKNTELGLKGNHKHIWLACVDCDKGRWVQLVRGKPRNLRCGSCASKKFIPRRYGQDNTSWKGGKYKTTSGYTMVVLRPDDFFYPMADKQGYVREHRLVMAKYLQRCLLSWEVIHHKNENKNDNRLENLELLPSARYHLPSTEMHRRIKQLEKQVEEQGKQIKLLQWQIKEREESKW